VSSKAGVLEPLRVRIRRFQFIVGLGFLSLVMGSILSVSLTMRLQARVQSLPLGLMRMVMAVALENLWVLAVLPVLCYGAARVLDLRPWKTAVGAAVSGAVFIVALDFVRDGADGLWSGGLPSVLRLVSFVAGIALTGRAVMMGRADASVVAKKVEAKAEARKSEYDEFLKAAEQAGARLEQREGAAPASTAVTSLPAEAPVSAPEPSTEATPANDVSKTPAA
jgi:hypothetical protein